MHHPIQEFNSVHQHMDGLKGIYDITVPSGMTVKTNVAQSVSAMTKTEKEDESSHGVKPEEEAKKATSHRQWVLAAQGCAAIPSAKQPTDKSSSNIGENNIAKQNVSSPPLASWRHDLRTRSVPSHEHK